MNNLLLVVYNVNNNIESGFYSSEEYTIEDIKKEISSYGKYVLILGIFKASCNNEDFLAATEVNIENKIL